MQFKYLQIKNLFGLYNYQIDLEASNSNDKKLTIFTGPNGYGKTTILTILDSLNTESLYYFYLLKYETIRIGFDDGTYLTINQNFINEDIPERDSDVKQSSVKEVRFNWFKNDGSLLCFLVYNDSLIRKAINNLRFILMGRNRLEDWEQAHNRNKILLKSKQFNEYIAHANGQDLFLMQLEGVRTKFIHANRIYNEANERNEILPIQKVRKSMQRNLNEAYQNFLLQSQRIDNLFIKNVISQKKSEIVEEDYNKLVNEVQKKHDELSRFKLVDKIEIPAYESDNSFILYTYLKGLSEKYDNFRNLPDKLILFDKLLKNKKFANKSVVFSPQHGFQIISTSGDILDESLLSSGEQNEIVLLYQLIFEVADNTILLIDEPENSLHIVWQQTLLNDIQEIVKTKKLQVIIATHSMSIVSKGRENAIDLYYLQHEQL